MKFEAVTGQNEIKKHLIQTVKEGRISHAQLFLGQEGSGTLPLAIAYAQYILCTDKKEEDACGACPSCLKMQGLNHPDLHFSYPIHLSKDVRSSDEAAGEWREMLQEDPYFNRHKWYQKLGAENKQGVIGTEESQKIVKKISFKSFEGGYKILIMWLPELMNTSASNKLLKIIEEPPEKTLFVLVAESQENIIPTIISRTQIVKIPDLKEAEIATFLQEKYGVEKESSQVVAHLSERNISRAISLLNQQESASFNFDNFVEWMRLCYQRNIAKTIDWVDVIAASGRETQKNFLLFSLHMFRQSIVGHYAPHELVVLTKEQDGFLKKFAPFINHKNIIGLTEVVNEGHYHLERNANPKILFLDLSLKIFALLKLK